MNFPPSQTDINDPESLELERIYVRKQFKGRGLGRQLIEKTLILAEEKDCRFVWLGVWERNEAALEFYKKMGFAIFGNHSFRMGEELQNDFVLKKDLRTDSI